MTDSPDLRLAGKQGRGGGGGPAGQSRLSGAPSLSVEKAE